MTAQTFTLTVHVESDTPLTADQVADVLTGHGWTSGSDVPSGWIREAEVGWHTIEVARVLTAWEQLERWDGWRDGRNDERAALPNFLHSAMDALRVASS